MSHFQALEGSELQISYDTWRPGDDRALGWGFLSRGEKNGWFIIEIIENPVKMIKSGWFRDIPMLGDLHIMGF